MSEGVPTVGVMSHHWRPTHALTLTPTGWLMHDGRTLIARIEKVHIRHREALHAVSPDGWTITYGPPGDIDFIATAVWVPVSYTHSEPTRQRT